MSRRDPTAATNAMPLSSWVTSRRVRHSGRGRTLDARIETSVAAGERLIDALDNGVRDFVLTSRDGSVSTRVRLSVAMVSVTEHIVGGQIVSVDWGTSTVARGRDRVSVSRTELRLLAGLLEANGEAVARSALIERVWADGGMSSVDRENALAVYVCSLRKRLSTIGVGTALQTVRRFGYAISAVP